MDANAEYTVIRDEVLGIYRVYRDGKPFRVVCQTILEIRLGIALPDAKVIELATEV